MTRSGNGRVDLGDMVRTGVIHDQWRMEVLTACSTSSSARTDWIPSDELAGRFCCAVCASDFSVATHGWMGLLLRVVRALDQTDKIAIPIVTSGRTQSDSSASDTSALIIPVYFG